MKSKQAVGNQRPGRWLGSGFKQQESYEQKAVVMMSL